MAPVLLFQVLVLAPVGLTVLAGSREESPSRLRLLTQPLRTPVVIGCALGLLVAVLGVRLPSLVLQPIELLAALAVPAALLAVVITSALPTAQNVRVRDRLRPAHPPGTGRGAADGGVMTAAIRIGEQVATSLEFWARLVEQGHLDPPVIVPVVPVVR